MQRPAAVPVPSRRPRRLGTVVAAVAAIWVFVLGIGVSLGSLPIVPEVEQLALQHAAAEEGDMTMGFEPMDMKKMMDDDPAVVPDLGHGMGLDSVYEAGDLVQAVYSDGDHAVSVFHERGFATFLDEFATRSGGRIFPNETGITCTGFSALPAIERMCEFLHEVSQVPDSD